jgi:LysM repeat protein
MTTIIKSPTGSYQVQQGDTLSKIATTQGRTLAELLEMNPQYAGNPNLVRTGEIVNPPITSYPPEGLYGENVEGKYNYAGPQAPVVPPPTVTLNNLMGGKGGGSSSSSSSSTTSSSSGKKMSVTQALVAILKEAQGINQKGQESLMKQSQGIAGQGLKESGRIFRNPLLTPSSGTNLGLSAQGSFDPLQLSIENQQKLANSNLENITGLVDRGMTAEENRLDREVKATAAKKMSKTDIYNQYVGFGQNKLKASTGPDGYVDPYVYMQAFNDWTKEGIGTAADFIREFPPKYYVNPEANNIPGLLPDYLKNNPKLTAEEEDLKLIESIFNKKQ